MSSGTILAATCCQPTSVIHPYIVRDYRFSLPAFSRKGGSFDCHTNCSNNVIARIAWIRKFISSALCILILSRRNNAVARRDNTVSRVSPVFCCATVDCRWWLSCMMRAYLVHALGSTQIEQKINSSASLLLCFSIFPTSLLLCFSASQPRKSKKK